MRLTIENTFKRNSTIFVIKEQRIGGYDRTIVLFMGKIFSSCIRIKSTLWNMKIKVKSTKNDVCPLSRYGVMEKVDLIGSCRYVDMY